MKETNFMRDFKHAYGVHDEDKFDVVLLAITVLMAVTFVLSLFAGQLI